MAEAAKKVQESPKKLEAVPAASAAQASEKKKFDVLGLVSVVIISLNLAAVAGLGIYMKKIWAKMMEVETKMETVMEAQKEQEAPAGKQKMGRTVTTPVPTTLYPLESFLVNISSDQGPKFLQTQMELELTDSATEDEITKKKAAIRDAIIVLLSSRSYKQIRETSGMTTLRRDILHAVNNLLSSGKVREVYFTQFHFN